MMSHSPLSHSEPDHIHKEKEQHLKGETKHSGIPGSAGWSEALGSASEAVIKADKAAHVSIDKLQEQTVKILSGDGPDGKHEGRAPADAPSIKANLKKK